MTRGVSKTLPTRLGARHRNGILWTTDKRCKITREVTADLFELSQDLGGWDSLSVQQRILSTYLNSTPLSSRLGYGEIIGIGDGLWAWYGTDLREANRMLAETDAVPSPRKAEIYKQMLSLLLAERRPSYYLLVDRQALEALTDRHLHLLSAAGIIDPALRETALKAAIREMLPETVWQRCYVHFLRNALDYVPRRVDDDCLQELRWLYDRRDLAEARRDLAAWLSKWSGKYPKLTGWVEENIDETLTFYRLPRQHHKHLKSTNMLERLNEEIKRRTHVVRIFPNGESCLRLVRALAVETHENWLEQHRYLNMDDLREHKKEALRRAA